MSTNTKLSKVQMSKIIQLGGFLNKRLANVIDELGKKALIDLAVPLAKDVLPKLAIKATLFILDKVERNISGKGAVRAENGFTLFILNEDMD